MIHHGVLLVDRLGHERVETLGLEGRVVAFGVEPQQGRRDLLEDVDLRLEAVGADGAAGFLGASFEESEGHDPCFLLVLTKVPCGTNAGWLRRNVSKYRRVRCDEQA